MLKKIRDVVLTIVFVVVVFFAGAATMHFAPGIFGIEKKDASTVEKEENDTFDLTLPGETEKRVVTVEEVKVKLDELSDFSTYMGTYSVTMAKDEMRYWMERFEIPGSKNSIQLKCDGVVKVGYDFKKIKVRVDDTKIYISLPEPKVNDNYVIWDTVECTESNSILNPLNFSQYQELIKEIEEKGLEEAESKGIYKAAEDNLKVLIGGFLSEFSDYEIVYM